MRRAVLVVSIAWIAVLATVAPAPTASATLERHPAPQTENASRSSTTASADVQVSVAMNVSLARNRSGMVRMTARYELGPDVETLVVYPREGSRLLDRRGFRDDPSTPGQLWTNGTRTPELTVLVPVNGSMEGGKYSVATDEWAFLDSSVLTHAYWSKRADGWRGENATATWLREDIGGSSGVTGAGNVYVGPADTYRGGNLTLHVAGPTSLARPPDVTLSFFAWMESSFRIAGRPESLTVFVLPEPIYYGFAEGEGENRALVVRGGRSTAQLAPTFAHEYVHARQAFATTEEMDWLTEASASYYGDLLLYRSGHWSADRFFAEMRNERAANATLADPETWTDGAPYDKGKRVLAALDAKIRRTTDGRRSLTDVMRRVNRHEGPVSYRDFVRMVATTANESMGDWLDAYLRSDGLPAVPRDAALYVLAPDSDPDGDGLSNAAERDTDTRPFVADERTRDTKTATLTQATPDAASTRSEDTPTADDRAAQENGSGTTLPTGTLFGGAVAILALVGVLRRRR